MTLASPATPTGASASGPPASGIGGLATDLAAASLALARRFFAGGTMW